MVQFQPPAPFLKMNIDIKKGKYVVAVSGGVDSVALLDLLVKQAKSQEPRAQSSKNSQLSAKDFELVVAHFDHGIRSDSKEDRKLVANLSQKYNLPFEFNEGKLGKDASEEQARRARYEFLQQIRKKHNAKAIITAHHQDDLIETALINLMRGTFRKGLTSLGSTNHLIRPLLSFSKKTLVDYATRNKLTWREDSTNSDPRYLRNWLRNNILSELSQPMKTKLLTIHEGAKKTNQEIDHILDDLVSKSNELDKTLITQSDHRVSLELIAQWLRNNKIEFDKKTLELTVVKIKTLGSAKYISLKQDAKILIGPSKLTIIRKQ